MEQFRSILLIVNKHTLNNLPFDKNVLIIPKIVLNIVIDLMGTLLLQQLFHDLTNSSVI